MKKTRYVKRIKRSCCEAFKVTIDEQELIEQAAMKALATKSELIRAGTFNLARRVLRDGSVAMTQG